MSTGFSIPPAVRVGLGATSTGMVAQKSILGLAKPATPVVGHFMAYGMPVATGALAAMSLWNHQVTKDEITREFDDEIGARRRKGSAHGGAQGA